jgi:hypothetical protein
LEAATPSTSPGVAAYDSAAATIAKFSTGLKVVYTANTAGDAKATVSSLYKLFSSAGTAGTSKGVLGSVLVSTETAPKGRDGSAAVTLNDLLSNAAVGSLFVDGNMAAASSVFLATSNTCGTSVAVGAFTASSAATGSVAAVEPRQSATIALPASLASAPYGATSASAGYLCYTADTATTASQIAKATVYGKITLVASGNATGITQQTTKQLMGTVTRDGTTLQAPFVQTTSGYVSRIVLTNSGDSDATYTGTVYPGMNLDGTFTNTVKDAGTTTGAGASLTGTIKAKGQVIIEGNSMPQFTNATRGWISFDIGGVNSAINGVYQFGNPTTGAFTNTNMVRPSNAYGSGSTAVD